MRGLKGWEECWRKDTPSPVSQFSLVYHNPGEDVSAEIWHLCKIKGKTIKIYFTFYSFDSQFIFNFYCIMDDSEKKKKKKERNGWGWSFHPFNRFCKIFKFLIWGSRSSKFSIRPLGSLEIKEDSDDSDREESKGISELKKTMENHMTMATLIATVTFATGFTLPGGYIQDKDNNQGMAVLSFPSLPITRTDSWQLQ